MSDITHICANCIGNESLRLALYTHWEDSQCDVCQNNDRCATIEAIGDIIDRPLRLNYRQGEFDVFSRFGGYEGDDLTNILQDELGIDYEESEALAQYLYDNDPAYPPDGEDAFFDPEMSYVKDFHPHSNSRYNWEQYSESIKHHARFYGPLQTFIKDVFTLPKLFPDINEDQISLFPDLLDRSDDTEFPVLKLLPNQDTHVYRARVAKTQAEVEKFIKKPNAELSYNNKTPSAGRMNAEGITAFYCSLSKDTTLKEMRPSIESMVVIGKFEVLKPIKLLDLTQFREHFLNDIFSPTYEERNDKITFLEEFDRIISRPIQPHHEALEYLPTQIVAEYVHHVLHYDGLVYSSAQEANGDETNKNIVIFNCSKWEVKNLDQPAEEQLDSSADDPWIDPPVRNYLLGIKAADTTALIVSEISYKTRDIILDPYQAQDDVYE